MKANYNSLIYAYESNSMDILNIIADEFDIATEAEENTASSSKQPDASAAVSDTVKSDEKKSIDTSQFMSKLVERIKKLIKKIGDIFNSLKLKLMNRLRLMNQTDQGFFKLYYKHKSMIKPYKNVRVVSYQYNNKILDQPMEKLISETTACLDKLRDIKNSNGGNSRINEILNADQGHIVEVLLKPYVLDSSLQITNVSDFVKHIVTNYRGEKKELVYQDSQLPQIEANAMTTKEIATRCNKYIGVAQESYNKLKTLEYQINRNSDDQNVIKQVSANAAKAATLYNAYSALLHAYYELKLEQSLNYRVILKKFYQM